MIIDVFCAVQWCTEKSPIDMFKHFKDTHYNHEVYRLVAIGGKDSVIVRIEE